MSEFVKVAESAGIEPGMLQEVEVGGRTIALANVGGTIYAIDNTCTHRGCSLAEGELDGEVVTCPCHGGQYNVKTGEVLRSPPPRGVQSFAVKVEGGSILVDQP